MKIEVKNLSGENTGRSVDLPKEVFAVKPNDHAIYLAVVAEMANKRHGTHSTLERSYVSGTTKKPWRQKGTGGARAGSVKTPLWPGGAITFGPRPHLYKKDLNVKVRRLARKSALTYKANDGRIVVVEDFHTLTPEAPKTREVASLLKTLGLKASMSAHTPAKKGKKKRSEETEEKPKKSKRITKVLMLLDKTSAVKKDKDAAVYENFRKSCRNIPGLKVSVIRDVSTYDIMNSDVLLFHESALKNVGTAFGTEN